MSVINLTNLVAGDVAEVGLSIGHISPQAIWDEPPQVAQWYTGGTKAGSLVAGEGRSSQVEYTPDGSFLKVSKPSVYAVAGSIPRPGVRGAVSGFSRLSRNRLMQLLSKINRGQLPVFVTLTYPGEFPGEPSQWKRHLDTFGKRFRREFPHGSFIWKLEPQQRGAPHYHLLAWGGVDSFVFLGQLLAWVSATWYEVVASGDERHLRAGTRVELVRSWGGVVFYASKYMSKPVVVGDDAWGRAGRFWGIVGRSNLPVAALVVLRLGYNQACDLMRWLRRFRGLPGRDALSLWAVVSSPEKWIDAVEQLAHF